MGERRPGRGTSTVVRVLALAGVLVASSAVTTLPAPAAAGPSTVAVPRPADGEGDAAEASTSVERPGGVIVHLFEWTWADVARECEEFLGPNGYEAVQVSPPNEHVLVAGRPWWQRYQPVSYQLTSRSGTRAEFASMVGRCRAAGVDIYVDAVINHMAAVGSGTGSGGSTYTPYDFPGLWTTANFHHCGRNGTDDIANYQDRYEVQNCELLNLADLDTGSAAVRDRIAAYLNDLVDLGVAGFRIDAAKHIAASDIAAIESRLHGDPYVYQEVIEGSGEPIRASEYVGNGDVTEFAYSREISRVFLSGQLSWLSNFGPSWGFLPSANAQVFTDNHDNQRGHGSGGSIITFKNGALHDLANVFALGWPYGHPSVMSSYDFTNTDQGPPSDANGNTTSVFQGGVADCDGPWMCEHRHRPIAGMVGFRSATAANPSVTDWWTNGNDQIAFGRGSLGYVVVNAETAPVTRTFQTGMAAGTYCNVTVAPVTRGACASDTVTIDAAGRFTATVPAMSALAIHVGALAAGTITGVVTDEVSGAPIAGGWVLAIGAHGALTGAVTAANGTYSMAVAPGPYRVELLDPSGRHAGELFDDRALGDFEAARVVAVAAASSSTVSAALAPAGPTGSITGSVTRDGSGAAVGGAWVVALDGVTGTVRGGAVASGSGAYAIGGLPAGSYKLAILDPTGAHAFEFQRDRADFALADRTTVTAGRATSVDVGLAVRPAPPSPTASIRGAVTDAVSGAPVACGWVVAIGSDGSLAGGAATAADGSYTLAVAPGQYRVELLDPSGRHTGEFFDDRPLGDYAGAALVTATVGAPATVSAALTPAGPTGSIAGTVTNDGSGAAVGGAWVIAVDAATGAVVGGAVANGAGAYVIGGLPAGSYKLAIIDPTGAHVFEFDHDRADFAQADPVAVAAGRTAAVNPRLAPAPG